MRLDTPLVVSLCGLLLFSCDITSSHKEEFDWTKGKRIATAGDTDILDSLKMLYQEDAARLALRDVHSNQSTKETLIEIPTELIDLYYHGLMHVYNATSLTARDSVVEIFEIHAWPYPETHTLIVAVDSTETWVNAWKNGIRLTGNSEVDNLMKTYDLQLDRYYRYRWPTSHAAVLQSPNPLNILALSQKFKDIDGVGYAEPNGYIGDGNDITGLIESHYLEFDYSFGYGDCPAGCINRHYWVFHVGYNGTVEFVESYGDRLP